MSRGDFAVAESKWSAIVICDAGPLIHLDELGCLNLLSDFRNVIVCDAVWNEVARHRPSALRRPGVPYHRLNVDAPAEPKLSELASALSLGAGEFSSLLIMQLAPDAILLTDDAAARLAAEQLGYDVHGTVGIIARALPRGQISCVLFPGGARSSFPSPC
jgi:predicted nucleic acid-binding protein